MLRSLDSPTTSETPSTQQNGKGSATGATNHISETPSTSTKKKPGPEPGARLGAKPILGSDAVRRNKDVTDMIMAGETAEKVASKFGITPNRVYQIVGKTTYREQVLLFLYEHQHEKYTSRQIAQSLSADIKKVEFQVDRLKKKGEVNAKHAESRADAGEHKMWYDIQLTNAGMSTARGLVPKKKAADKVSINESKEPRFFPPEAERIAAQYPSPLAIREAEASVALDHDEEMGTQSFPVVEEAAPTPTEDQQSGGDVANQMREDLKEEVAAQVQEQLQATKTLAIKDIPKYRHIWHLVDRNRKVAEAAHLLEQAGFDDLSLAALSKVDDFTPLEKEIIEYVREYGETETEG